MAGAHTIDIEQLVKSMTSEKDHGWSRSEGAEPIISRPLIYRIDKSLRYKHNNAYEPIMLSLGPYNHRVPWVHAMQATKYKLLFGILNLNHEKTLPDYMEQVGQLEKQVKCCYADEITLDRSNFLKMLLLDGCFVLVAILGTEWYTPDQQEPENSNGRNDVIRHKVETNSALNEKLGQDGTKLETVQSDIVLEDTYPIDQLYSLDLWYDVLLLENQIPFFVISKLYEFIVGGSSTTTSILTEKIINFVEDSLHCYPKAIQKHNRPKEFFHLLQLCHLYFRPSIAAAQDHENQAKSSLIHNFFQLGGNLFSKYKERSFHKNQQAIPSRRATNYHQAGIDFKKRKYCSKDPHSLLDVVFCNGVLEVPGLTIDPNTQSLFCNLLVFEQTCPQFGNYFTAYITFFCSLIKMPDDVALLTKRGIIVHQLNSDAEVCDLFRMIMECAISSLGFDGCNYLKSLCSEIEEHYQNKRPVWKELLSSITSRVHSGTKRSESSESLMTTSQELPV